MRSFVIVGLQALIGMILIALAFIVWASLFNGYPWRERFLVFVWLAVTPFIVRAAIRLLRAGRRSGVLLALLCVLVGPTPMFFNAAWVWKIGLIVPILVVWFQLGRTTQPASTSESDAS